MYRLYATLLLFCIVSAAYAQDIIQRTDGVKIEGKVLEVKGAEIQFTKKAEDGRNIYIISKEDVASVTYQDGTVEQYNTSGSTSALSPAASRSTASPDVAVNRGHHIIAMRPLDLIFTNFSFLYEHLSKNYKFGIRFPLSIGVGHGQITGDVYGPYYMLRNRTFSSGLDLNFYIGTPDRFRYYIGPSLQLGFFKYRFYDYRSPTVVEQNRTGTQFALLMNNGLWYQISKSAVLGMDLGLGFQKRATSRESGNYYGNSSRIKLSANISAGFQF
jgi:hypothetical protein